MGFGSFNPHRQQAMMADINVTPMVDVMLVLLVIFIITAPMFTHTIKLDLPRAQAGATQQPAAAISLSIDAAGKLYWNNVRVDETELDARLSRVAALAEQPELQLRADKDTRYEIVAQLMATIQAHGLTRLGFVTEPKKENKHGQG